MAKIEHVSLDKGLLDFFVCPIDEELVVKVRLLSETTTEVDWVLQTCSLPIGLQQDAQFLRSAQRKHGNQHFTAFIESLMDLSQKFSLTTPFAVSDRGGIRCLSQNDVRTQFINPSRS